MTEIVQRYQVCGHAQSGCNYPESECIGMCHNIFPIKKGVEMSDTPKQKTPQDLLDQIKYQVLPHSNCSQICQGIYPEGVTQDDVRRKVCGTFGGRFESFGGGHFRYIAYTD